MAQPAHLAGGNQWDYLGRWPSELHDSLAVVEERGATVGGISAGAVSLREGAFDARYGTVTSDDALAAPMRREVSLASPVFAQPELDGVLVDSHFMERERSAATPGATTQLTRARCAAKSSSRPIALIV